MRKALLVIPGYCVGLGGLLLITYRTLLAFGSESKAIIVHVNSFGEQYLDLVCLVFLWVVCLVGLFSLSSLIPEKKPKEGFFSEKTRNHVGMTSLQSFHKTDSFLLQPLSVAPGEVHEVLRYPDMGSAALAERPGTVSVSFIISPDGFPGKRTEL